MTRAAALTVLAALAVSGAAQAQVAPWRPGVSTLDRHRYQADRLRQQTEIDRLQSQQRDLTARQMRIEAQLESQAIRARRQPELIPEPAPRTLGSPEAEAAARRGATERRQSVQSGVGQIDAWLDRAPN